VDILENLNSHKKVKLLMINKKVLIIDHLEASVVNNLSSVIEVDYRPNIELQELFMILYKYEILILRSGYVMTKEWLDQSPQLKIVIRAGVGTDNIPVDYLLSKGIKFYNIPDASTQSVAEFGLLAALMLMRNFNEATNQVRNGVWDKSNFIGNELKNKTVGFIGFGRIGRALYHLLSNFSINPIYCSLNSKTKLKRLKKVYLLELASIADLIFIQVPLNNLTYHMISKEFLNRIKSSSFIINLSRFDVIDMDSLYKFLKSGLIKGVVVDPVEKRNMAEISKFQKLPIYFTPHIAGSTCEAQTRLGNQIISIIQGEYIYDKK